MSLASLALFPDYLHHQPCPQAERLAEAFFLDDTGDIKAVILDGVKQLLFLLIEARFKPVLVFVYPLHNSCRLCREAAHLFDGADIAIVELVDDIVHFRSLLGNTQYRREAKKSGETCW